MLTMSYPGFIGFPSQPGDDSMELSTDVEKEYVPDEDIDIDLDVDGDHRDDFMIEDGNLQDQSTSNGTGVREDNDDDMVDEEQLQHEGELGLTDVDLEPPEDLFENDGVAVDNIDNNQFSSQRSPRVTTPQYKASWTPEWNRRTSPNIVSPSQIESPEALNPYDPSQAAPTPSYGDTSSESPENAKKYTYSVTSTHVEASDRLDLEARYAGQLDSSSNGPDTFEPDEGLIITVLSGRSQDGEEDDNLTNDVNSNESFSGELAAPGDSDKPWEQVSENIAGRVGAQHLGEDEKTLNDDADLSLKPILKISPSRLQRSDTEDSQEDNSGSSEDAAVSPRQNLHQHENSDNNLPPSVYTHPVIVVYQGNHILLFPPHEQHDDRSETFLLEDEGLAAEDIQKLLGACRLLLADSIIDHDELELKFPALGLELCETSTTSATVSLVEILDIYLRLHDNDGQTNPEPLQMTLCTKPNFSQCMDRLKTAADNGMGMNEMTRSEQQGAGVEEQIEPQDASSSESNRLGLTADGCDVEADQQHERDTDSSGHHSPCVQSYNQGVSTNYEPNYAEEGFDEITEVLPELGENHQYEDDGELTTQSQTNTEYIAEHDAHADYDHPQDSDDCGLEDDDIEEVQGTFNKDQRANNEPSPGHVPSHQDDTYESDSNGSPIVNILKETSDPIGDYTSSQRPPENLQFPEQVDACQHGKSAEASSGTSSTLRGEGSTDLEPPRNGNVYNTDAECPSVDSGEGDQDLEESGIPQHSGSSTKESGFNQATEEVDYDLNDDCPEDDFEIGELPSDEYPESDQKVNPNPNPFSQEPTFTDEKPGIESYDFTYSDGDEDEDDEEALETPNEGHNHGIESRSTDTTHVNVNHGSPVSLKRARSNLETEDTLEDEGLYSKRSRLESN